MTKTTRGRYTLEFKQEAVRLVEGGQSQASVARSLGVADQCAMSGAQRQRQRLPWASGSPSEHCAASIPE
jgi:transposase